MGSTFERGLTKTGVQTPSQQQFFDSPAEAGITAAREAVAPTYAANLVPSDVAGMPSNVDGLNRLQFAEDTPATVPLLFKPSFRDAGFDRYGNPKPDGPALTKLGAFASLLKGVAEGAAAGAGKQTFGEGFQAAQALPFQRAQMQQQVERGQIQNETDKAMLPFLRRQQEAGIAADEARAKMYQAQAEAANVKSQTPEEAISAKAAIAERYGFQRGTPEFNQLVFGLKMEKPSAPATVQTDRGVMQFNPQTGQYDIRVGGLPKQAAGSGDGGGGYKTMTPEQVAAVGLPKGTVAQVGPKGQIEVVNKPKSAELAPKDVTTIKQKLSSITLAKKQLADVQSKFDNIKDWYTAGPIQGWLPSPGGKAFDAAVDSMRGTLTSLTRVPGVGAMSDYETRLDQAKFPVRSNYESVTQQQIDSIAQILSQLENGYMGMLSDDGGGPATAIPPNPYRDEEGWELRDGIRVRPLSQDLETKYKSKGLNIRIVQPQ